MSKLPKRLRQSLQERGITNPHEAKVRGIPKSLWKAAATAARGLGTPLGQGIAKIDSVQWEKRKMRWRRNRDLVETHLPGIFSSNYFYQLPRLGGRSEGEVREIALSRKDIFYSTHKDDNRRSAYRYMALKKFNKNARSGPEEQAMTLHSLNCIKDYWVSQGKWPIQVHVAEAITYKYPFLLTTSFSGERWTTAEHLPKHLKEDVYQTMRNIGNLIVNAEQRLVKQFKLAGIRYPSPDFIPSNIMVHTDEGGRITHVWIIDQFSVPKSPTGERKLQRGGWKRMTDRQRWGLD